MISSVCGIVFFITLLLLHSLLFYSLLYPLLFSCARFIDRIEFVNAYSDRPDIFRFSF